MFEFLESRSKVWKTYCWRVEERIFHPASAVHRRSGVYESFVNTFEIFIGAQKAKSPSLGQKGKEWARQSPKRSPITARYLTLTQDGVPHTPTVRPLKACLWYFFKAKSFSKYFEKSVTSLSRVTISCSPELLAELCCRPPISTRDRAQ